LVITSYTTANFPNSPQVKLVEQFHILTTEVLRQGNPYEKHFIGMLFYPSVLRKV